MPSTYASIDNLPAVIRNRNKYNRSKHLYTPQGYKAPIRRHTVALSGTCWSQSGNGDNQKTSEDTGYSEDDCFLANKHRDRETTSYSAFSKVLSAPDANDQFEVHLVQTSGLRKANRWRPVAAPQPFSASPIGPANSH